MVVSLIWSSTRHITVSGSVPTGSSSLDGTYYYEYEQEFLTHDGDHEHGTGNTTYVVADHPEAGKIWVNATYKAIVYSQCEKWKLWEWEVDSVTNGDTLVGLEFPIQMGNTVNYQPDEMVWELQAAAVVSRPEQIDRRLEWSSIVSDQKAANESFAYYKQESVQFGTTVKDSYVYANTLSGSFYL
ncbi:MAG: hypothetical protein ACTSU5_16835 [Promethearchaeota archaeon]